MGGYVMWLGVSLPYLLESMVYSLPVRGEVEWASNLQMLTSSDDGLLNCANLPPPLSSNTSSS